MAKADQQIVHERPAHEYFTMLPNLYDDADLSQAEYRLLGHYTRVGNCFEGRRTTATHCRMNKDTVTKARDSLAQKGFIRLEAREGDTVLVTVVDVWRRNATIYGGPNGGGRKQGQVGQKRVTQGAKLGSGGDRKEGHKEEPLKKNPAKKKKRARNSAQPLPIQLYRSIAHRTPPKRTWDMIDAQVDGNVLEFARHLRWWTLSNHDPTNYWAVMDAFHQDARHRGYTPKAGKGGAQQNLEELLAFASQPEE